MNSIIITGRVYEAPRELGGSPSSLVAGFTLVENILIRKGSSTKAQFYDIVAYGMKAESILRSFQKGDKVTVIGSIDDLLDETGAVKKRRIVVERWDRTPRKEEP